MTSIAGWWRMVRLQWRTSWPMLLGTPVLLAALVTGVSAGIGELYPDAATRAMYEATLGASPAAAAFNGRGYDLSTLGGIASYEVGFMGQLGIPILGVLLAIRLTRSLEDSGALELITSTPVSRVAVPFAAAKSVAASWMIFAILAFAGLVALDFPAAGSAAYAGILSLFGVAASALGLVVAQLSRTARGATGLGLGLAFVAFLVRAVVDGLNLDLVWLSPLGWVAEVRPWGDVVAWPYIAFGAVAVVLTVAALLVCAGRDLGSGILAQRLGPDGARPGLASPLGLAWRLVRGGVLAWMILAVVWAMSVGALSQEFVDAIESNPSLAEFFGASAQHLGTVLSVLLSAVLATAVGISVLARHGAEEVAARVGLAHAGRVTRWRWWTSWSGLAIVAAAVTLMASVVALGWVQQVVMDEPSALGDAVGAGVDLLAPVLAMVAVSALLVAAWPRLRGFAWILPAWVFVVGVLGEALQMPEWLAATSPVQLVGKVPLEDADGGAILALVVVSAVALALSFFVVTRRDLARG